MGSGAARRRPLTRRQFLVASALGLSVLTPATYLVVRSLTSDGGESSRYTAAGWRKYGWRPVLGPGLGTCFDVSVLSDAGLYRMWFSWRPKASIALAESADGVHWCDPVIVLGPNTGSGWEADANRPSVLKLNDGYHLWYTGQANGRSAIGYATSEDGRSFQRHSTTPVLSPELPWERGAVMSPHVLYDPSLRLFRMWYSAGENYEPNAIGYATSADGLFWTKYAANPIFSSKPQNLWEKDRVTACQVVQFAGWHVMFYIGFSDVSHAQIGLARSRDGITGWERHRANPIIRPSPESWDQDAVYKPYAIFDSRRWLLWYNGRRAEDEQIGLAFHAGGDLGF